MTKEDEFAVRVQRYIDAPPERVFDAWIVPEKLRAWMGRSLESVGGSNDSLRRVEADARVGGRFFFSDMREDGEARHFGTYLVVDRPRKMAFSWFTSEEEEKEDHSTVTLTFEPKGGGCQVTLIHEMSAKWADYAASVEKSWGGMLEQIEALETARTDV